VAMTRGLDDAHDVDGDLGVDDVREVEVVVAWPGDGGDGQPDENRDLSAVVVVRDHDGHVAQSRPRTRRGRADHLVDEVAQTAVTMPGGEAAPGADSPTAEQQARRDAAIVYKDLRLVIGEQRNRGQGHGLSDGASCWLSASTSVPELLLLRDCSVSPEKLQKCNRGGRRGTDTELQRHS